MFPLKLKFITLTAGEALPPVAKTAVDSACAYTPVAPLEVVASTVLVPLSDAVNPVILSSFYFTNGHEISSVTLKITIDTKKRV
ncbi:hypothetical protein KSF_005870 [Reticulibacter mediterranei]|uniref:Uncharacterized protein n=1 Tax=Reticulibacter mediterranei TaxID=2778369 RepID=A0A8J3I802_9CHLR|nr:hypothetical protein KSF_005870 [Reticulibacter mediterranei]